MDVPQGDVARAPVPQLAPQLVEVAFDILCLTVTSLVLLGRSWLHNLWECLRTSCAFRGLSGVDGTHAAGDPPNALREEISRVDGNFEVPEVAGAVPLVLAVWRHRFVDCFETDLGIETGIVIVTMHKETETEIGTKIVTLPENSDAHCERDGKRNFFLSVFGSAAT